LCFCQKNKSMNQKGFIPIIFIIIGAIVIASATFGIVKYKDEITASVIKVFQKSEVKTENQESREQKSQAALKPEETGELTKETDKNITSEQKDFSSQNKSSQSQIQIQPNSQSQPTPTPTPDPIPAPASASIPTPTIDLCNNIEGAQSYIPAGLIADGNGKCVAPFQSSAPTPTPTPTLQPQPNPAPTPTPTHELSAIATIKNIPDTVVSIKFSIVNDGQDVLKINHLRFRLNSFDPRVEGMAISIGINFPNSADKNNGYNFDNNVSSDTNIFNTSFGCDPQTGWNGCTRCLEKVSGHITCKQSDVFINEIRPGETAYVELGIGMANSFPSDGTQFKFTLEHVDGSITGKTSGNDVSFSDVKLESAPQPQSITASIQVKSLDSIPLSKNIIPGKDQYFAIFNISSPVGLWIKSMTLTAIANNTSNNHLTCYTEGAKDLTSGIPRLFYFSDFRTSGDAKINVICTVYLGETSNGTWQIRLDSIEALDMKNGKPVIFTDLPAMGDVLTVVQP